MIVYSRSLSSLLWAIGLKNGTLGSLVLEFQEAAMVSVGPRSCLRRGSGSPGLLLLPPPAPLLGAAGNAAGCQQCPGAPNGSGRAEGVSRNTATDTKRVMAVCSLWFDDFLPWPPLGAPICHLPGSPGWKRDGWDGLLVY